MDPFSSAPPPSGKPQVVAQPNSMSSSMSTASSHPLAHTLASLRTQLAQVQRAAHTQGMQLQGRVLEATMAREGREAAEREMQDMRREMEVLRSAGLPQTLAEDPTTTPAVALSALTLAHRRLSALLSQSHERGSALSHALAASEAAVYAATQRADRAEGLLEAERARREVVEDELRRSAAEERAREEEGRVVKLALKEAMERLERYEGQGVQGVEQDKGEKAEEEQRDLNEVPERSQVEVAVNGDHKEGMEDSKTGPPTVEPYIANMQADAAAKPDQPTSNAVTHSIATPSTSLPSTPCNILQGITGIRRLFLDFTTQLSQQTGTIAALEARLGDTQAEVDTYRGMEEEERTRRVGVEDELVRMREADEGASQLVERYMAFSQKQASQLHATLMAQTARLNATIATLRASLLTTSRELSAERARTAALRSAMDELAAGYEREVTGRRREVALRIKGLEREERWADKGERWRERVRRERNRLGGGGNGDGQVNGMGLGAMAGARASSTSLASAASSGTPSRVSSPMPTPSRSNTQDQTGVLWELLESGLALFAHPDSPLSGVDLDVPVSPKDEYPDGLHSVDARTGRNVLAWDIYASLLQDLEEETQRRVALEGERSQIVNSKLSNGDVEQQDAQGGVDSKEESPGVEINFAQLHERSGSEPLAQPPVATATVDVLVDVEQTPRPESVATMGEAYAIHENGAALGALRDRLHRTGERYAGLQKSLHDCAHSLSALRAQAGKLETSAPAASSLASARQLSLLLDGVHDVVEDVRVEVEIAIADDERTAEGFQTLLTLQPGEKSRATAEAFLDGREKGARNSAKRIAGFERRLADVENDLIQLKVAQARMEAGEEEAVEEVLDDSPSSEQPRRQDILAPLQLRTVAVPSPLVHLDSPLTSPGSVSQQGNGMKRGFFGSLGRSLTGTTPNGSSSSVDSLQRGASMAGFRNTSLGAGSVGIMGGSGGMPGNSLPLPSPRSEHSRSGLSAAENDDDVE